jgi:hypothetical protein
MKFRVTITLGRDVVHQEIHDSDGAEPALREAMRDARKSNPSKPVYLSHVTIEPLEDAHADRSG